MTTELWIAIIAALLSGSITALITEMINRKNRILERRKLTLEIEKLQKEFQQVKDLVLASSHLIYGYQKPDITHFEHLKQQNPAEPQPRKNAEGSCENR
jgi:hypothetical protein